MIIITKEELKKLKPLNGENKGSYGTCFLYENDKVLKTYSNTMPFYYNKREIKRNIKNSIGVHVEDVSFPIDIAKTDEYKFSYIMPYIDGVSFNGLLDNISDIKINSPEDGVCHILNVSFLGAKGEVLLHHLAQQGVFVSTGSACSSKKKGSHVLNAIGLNPQEIDSAIRFSLSDMTTEEEIEKAIDIVKKSVEELRMIINRR
jgi:hypothetical protein